MKPQNEKITREKIDLGTIGRVVISKQAKKQIDSLHAMVGRTEWSGVMFYKLVSGNLKNMKNLVFKVMFIYPMDIGTESFTSINMDGSIMDAYDINPELVYCNTGLIHSHHDMDAFFSTTDMTELLANCANYNYYLSLIVNFEGDYVAKVAFPVKESVKHVTTITGEDGKPMKVTSTTNKGPALVGDLSVEPRVDRHDQWLVERVLSLKRQRTKATTHNRSIAGKKVPEYWPIPRVPDAEIEEMIAYQESLENAR